MEDRNTRCHLDPLVNLPSLSTAPPACLDLGLSALPLLPNSFYEREPKCSLSTTDAIVRSLFHYQMDVSKVRLAAKQQREMRGTYAIHHLASDVLPSHPLPPVPLVRIDARIKLAPVIVFFWWNQHFMLVRLGGGGGARRCTHLKKEAVPEGEDQALIKELVQHQVPILLVLLQLLNCRTVGSTSASASLNHNNNSSKALVQGCQMVGIGREPSRYLGWGE